jgi:hypothetical protein
VRSDGGRDTPVPASLEVINTVLIRQMWRVPIIVWLVATTLYPPSGAAAQQGPTSLIAFSGNDGNIWTVHTDGTEARKVTNADQEVRFSGPRWSPDGQALVFAGVRGSEIGARQSEDMGIYLWRQAEVQQVPNVTGCHSPAFSADGRRSFLHVAAQRIRVRSVDTLLRRPRPSQRNC